MSRSPSPCGWRPIAAMALLAAAVVVFVWGSNPWWTAPWNGGTQLVVDGTHLPAAQPLVEGETVLLSYDLLLDELQLPLYRETDETGVVIIATSPHEVLRMATDDLTAWLNQEELQLSLAPRMVDGHPYLPVRPLDRLYGLEVVYHDETDIVTVDRRRQPGGTLSLNEEAVLRQGPSRWTFGVQHLQAGHALVVYEELNHWYRVRSADGRPGYLPRDVDAAHDTLPVLAPHAPEPRPDRPAPPSPPINLTWDHVTPSRPQMADHGDPPPPGLDVISPTWFHLEDGEGNLQNLARAADMDWAESHGYHVWPLVTNSFDPDMTRELLHNFRHRERLIRQLLAYAELYGFHGINIDFENIYEVDGPQLVQFVRELAPLARQQGLVVSIDVTFHSQSPNWSRVYDRPALAAAVDYVMVMAYDEYPGGSRLAGSTASLPWVERGLERILTEVPAEQLILGIPFYTRVWELAAPDARERVGMRAAGMDAVDDLLASHGATPQWHDEYGQYVAAFSHQDRHYRVWLEEEQSLRARVALARRHNLAGIASWRRGLEQTDAWRWIAEELGP